MSIQKEVIVSKIHEIRGMKVMLSSDLTEFYNLETRRLNERVKRIIGRFPERYMFKFIQEEHTSLGSKNATLKRVGWQDEKIGQGFNYLKQFIKEQETPRKSLGYKRKGED